MTAAERRAAARLMLYKRFAALYISNKRNATVAYLALYPNSKRTSAASEGYKFLRIPEIISEVQRITDEAFRREHMSADEVLARMARIARFDVQELYWRSGELDSSGAATVPGQRKPLDELSPEVRTCVRGFKYDPEGRTLTEVWDSQLAQSQVAKHLKLLSDKVDVTIGLKLEDVLDEVAKGSKKT